MHDDGQARQGRGVQHPSQAKRQHAAGPQQDDDRTSPHPSILGEGVPRGALPATDGPDTDQPHTEQPNTEQPDTDQASRPVRAPERLLRALDRLERGRIAVISGPAGHGKNDLVRDWLASHPEHAWLELTDAATLAELPSRLPADGELLVAVVRGRQLLADAGFVQAALEVAERQPRLRLVFVGRVRPDAPLGSLAARGVLVDIDGDQLAWTRDEVATALAPLNPKLPATALDTIVAGMRGWPAIARMLAAEPLTWSHTSKVTRLADSYIEEEVLAGLDEADLQLLQELAALPSLDPLAAAWMSGRGDAAAQLTRLQAFGVPITWDEGNTIRLNPMLRGYLTRKLARTDPELGKQLNQRAALWLRNRGRTMEGIALAMQVGLVDLAWMLAGEFITTNQFRPELVQSLPSLVEMLPPGWEVDTVRAIARGLATPRTMVAQLGAIDAELMTNGTTTGRLGYACFVLGMVRRTNYTSDVDVTTALQIAEQADSKGVHELDLALLSAVQTEYGLWLLHSGKLVQAQEQLLNALGMARVVNVPWAIVTSLGALAHIHAELGSVAAAQRLAEEAILTSTDTVFTADGLDEFALLALATTAIDTGDLPAARRWLDQLDHHEEHLEEIDALRTAVQATLAIAGDDPAAAMRLVQAYRDENPNSSPTYHELAVAMAGFEAAIALDDVAAAQAEYQRLDALDVCDSLVGRVVLRARLALARSDPRTAYQLLQPLASTHDQGPLPHPKHTLYMLMIFGVAADDLHRADEALEAFQRAGVLADRMGLNTPSARHTRVAVASRREVPLTEAERNVLAHLDPTRTLTETADELFISLNTLKTHLRRIYKKLGVANREEAIDRARVMGIRSQGS